MARAAIRGVVAASYQRDRAREQERTEEETDALPTSSISMCRVTSVHLCAARWTTLES
jgi:hypothetical protein